MLGAGSGGDSVKQNGQGRPTNLVNTTVNGGGGYSNTAWEIETAGGGGSYAGKAATGSNNRDEVAGETTVTGNLPPSSVDPVVVVPVVGGMADNSVSVVPVPVVVAVVLLNLWLMVMDRS